MRPFPLPKYQRPLHAEAFWLTHQLEESASRRAGADNATISFNSKSDYCGCGFAGSCEGPGCCSAGWAASARCGGSG